MSKGNNRVRISSSALIKPVPVAGFIINNENLAKRLPKIFHYRKPKIVSSKNGIYIEYYYRIPADVRKFYDNQKWYRFRIREDINRRQGNDKKEYAIYLREQIEESLKKGYNPFGVEGVIVEQKEKDLEEKDELGAKDAILLFLEAWGKRGLGYSSMIRYKRTAGRLIEWLEKKHIPYLDIHEITEDHIEQFLNDLKAERNFSNREYNNTFDFTRTIFNYLLKKKYIDTSPCAGFKKQPAKSRKHRYFDENKLNEIFKVMDIMDPYLKFACQMVYYACIRSEMELKFLKVSNILWSENKIFAEKSKGDTERYIPLDTNLKILFKERGIDKYPGDYYIFGINGHPSKEHFGNGFFSKRFRKVRDAVGFDKNYTIYGFKHTRVVDLKQAGATDADIMSLTGHSDFAAYAKYLRDLGVTADADKLNKLSRKI